MFYANEHEPVHVHGKSQGRESRAEIIVLNGVVSEIRYASVLGRGPLDANEMRFFEEIVTVRADEIIAKWIDFFVLQGRLYKSEVLGEARREGNFSAQHMLDM